MSRVRSAFAPLAAVAILSCSSPTSDVPPGMTWQVLRTELQGTDRSAVVRLSNGTEGRIVVASCGGMQARRNGEWRAVGGICPLLDFVVIPAQSFREVSILVPNVVPGDTIRLLPSIAEGAHFYIPDDLHAAPPGPPFVVQ
ncbi:MAG: hypothetical protein ABIS00_14590 [Gemmatimonadales bacterium]